MSALFLTDAASADFRRLLDDTRDVPVRVVRRGVFVSDDRGGGRFEGATELHLQGRIGSLGASTVEQELSARFASRQVMRLSVPRGTSLELEETAYLHQLPWRIVAKVPVSTFATEEHYVVERSENG